MTKDKYFMYRALHLAKNGAGQTAPNPMVGAVLVFENRIIGEGWHQKFGTAHAEPNCINNVKTSDRHLISQSTLYVTLEPCSHYGKTPPCANIIIEYKISKIVIACTDPNPQVAGKGITILKEAGVEVQVGILDEEAKALNKRFFTFHQKKRPFVILKWAESLDGFIAPVNGQKVMLSNALVQRFVHKMRSEEAAILVGYSTAILDNPSLTNRFFGVHQPLRITINQKETPFPENLNIINDGEKSLIFNIEKQGVEGNCTYVKLTNTQDYIRQIVDDLFQRGVDSLIVEGGSKTLQHFIQSGLWDEAFLIKTPVVLGQGVPAPVLLEKVFENCLTLKDNSIEKFRKR
ncbi:MAG TPA: bifunctional diaminohydroxyphosphoribosylaminopyrimidine deaminase/5-amino-6-(5-phosphoribosylamino)uracil reductase RibD [Edaphocola sp.]|nr:bifunctional diaminohydroxyphosphoribosylaminopyrimidine deaminase/5-amino-6-(5-phosphoribosylamino)uracil reductase RibD [Edaphocola sp.]